MHSQGLILLSLSCGPVSIFALCLLCDFYCWQHSCFSGLGICIWFLDSWISAWPYGCGSFLSFLHIYLIQRNILFQAQGQRNPNAWPFAFYLTRPAFGCLSDSGCWGGWVEKWRRWQRGWWRWCYAYLVRVKVEDIWGNGKGN